MQTNPGSTTTSTFVYDANGQRVIGTVSSSGLSGSSTSTLYIGNLYEETLGGVGSSPPYIVYYSLGGKRVALRRANQGAQNGQYRLVGDQLGSTAVLIDTANPPTVVQRQSVSPVR